MQSGFGEEMSKNRSSQSEVASAPQRAVLIRRLRSEHTLTRRRSRDCAAAGGMSARASAQTSIVRTGERPNAFCLLVKEFACRAKLTDVGKRQILSFHVAGDIPDVQSLFLRTGRRTIKVSLHNASDFAIGDKITRSCSPSIYNT